MSPSKPLKVPIADDPSTESDVLHNTVGTFANRIQRRLKEQEERCGESQKAREERHARMLQAMTVIRKAFQETCKITLNQRFRLDLVVSDWEGWPRVDVNLVDSLSPDRIDYALTVTANDRRDFGIVQMAMKSGEILARLSLMDPKEMERLPLVLKKSVRQFLDVVASYVLDPIKPEDLLDHQSKPIDDEEFDKIREELKLKSADLFNQDGENLPQNNSVEIEDNIAPIESNAFVSKL